jgi:hypothetical protein
MYLAIDSPSGIFVFADNDPREEGFGGPVTEKVSLVEEFPELLRNKPPSHWLGVSEQSASESRVFPSPENCRSAGFRVLGTDFWTGKSWRDWQLHQEM